MSGGPLPTWPRHVVAAAALVRKGDSVLLVRTPRRGWEIPGGQVEEHEDVVAAAIREVAEESGVDIAVDALAAISCNLTASRLILDVTATWRAGEPGPSDETLAAEWVAADAALARVEHPLYRKRIEHLLEFAGRVLYRTYTTDPFHIVEERFL